MEPQPMGKVRDLSRLAGRVAARSTIRWSSLWKFLGVCLLAVVVGGPAVGLPHAQGAAGVAGMPLPAQGLALLPQRITFDPPRVAAVGQPVRLSASTDADASENLVVSFRSDTPDLCTVSGATVTATAPGFCVITATQGGDASYAPAPDVARAFLAHSGPALQTITFDPPRVAAVGQPVRLSASTDADASENLVVSFRSDTPDVCTVSGATVTATTADVCTITASQGGNDHYAAARSARRSFQAYTGTSRQTITFDPPRAAAVGQPVRLSASTDADGSLVVSFRSESPTVCTVSRATVTPVAGGRCDITAYQGGTATYAAAKESRSFRVTVSTDRLPQQIEFGPVPGTTVGVPVVLTASSRTLAYQRADPPTGLAVSYTSQNRRVCTVSGATVVPRTGGQCVITAAQDGNAQYLPAKSVTQEFPVARASQTISFTRPASATIDQPVILTATASSWLPVTYSSRTPNVCTVAGATLTPTAAGRCTVVASQPGDAQYAPADAMTASFAVGKIPQTISFSLPGSTTVDRPVILTATASSGLALIYASGSTDVCTVSGSTLTLAKAGTCTITASQPGDDKYLPAGPEARSFPVQKIPQTISFSPPGSATVGRPVILTATASSGLPVIYASGSTDVCTVSGSKLTLAKAGTCAITASQPGDARYAPADSITGSVPVGKIPQTISFTPPDGAEAGQRITLAASATSNLAVSFVSATPGVCTVSDRTATTIRAGACAVVASQAGDDRYAAAGSVRKSFPVARMPQTIDFRPPQDLAFGRPVTLIATASSGLPVSYRTSTPGVCTVSGPTVTTRAPGTCAITASQAGDDRYEPARDAARTFGVERAAQAITFIPPDGMTLGQPVTLSASASSGLDVSYHADTPAVCTVSGSSVSPATAGTCTMTASQPGNDDYAPAADISRSFPVRPGPGNGVRKDPQAIAFAQPSTAAVARVVPLSGSATSGLAVSFRSDTPSVCTVSGATATTIAAGTCAVTASQTGDDRFAAARDVQRSFTVHVSQAVGHNGRGKTSQTIFFGQLHAAAVGQVITLSASATSGLAVSVRSDTPAVCSVSGATVTTTTAGTCTVTGSQAGDDRYLAAADMTESFQVNAGHQAQTITFPPPPQAKVGEAATLSASATSGLLVAFRSDTPRICTVSGPTLTPIAGGTCTVTASQGGSDHYAAARDIAQSFDVASPTSGFPGALTILLGAVVFAAAGATSLVRRVRRSHRPPEPQPTVRADPVPGPPTLVSVQNTGAGVTHTVRIESSPGASITRIKEGKS
jgi:hypothetical protein